MRRAGGARDARAAIFLNLCVGLTTLKADTTHDSTALCSRFVSVGRERCTRYNAWPQACDQRYPHPYNARTEHVGFSLNRQALLAISAKRREALGESHDRREGYLECAGTLASSTPRRGSVNKTTRDAKESVSSAKRTRLLDPTTMQGRTARF